MVLRNRFMLIHLDGRKNEQHPIQLVMDEIIQLYIDILRIKQSLALELSNNSASYITIALTVGGDVIAAITGAPVDQDEIAIQHLAVRADMRGSGYGQYLVDLFRRYSLSHCYSVITLLSVETAVGFYKKQGFVMKASRIGLMALDLEAG